MELFLFILSWVLGPLSLTAVLLKIYLEINYKGSVDELLDASRNKKATFIYNLSGLFIVFILSLVYIIYYHTTY